MNLRNGPLSTKICTGAVLLKSLSSWKITGLGTFLIVLINLFSIKDGDIGNLRKSEYLYDYLRHSHTQGSENMLDHKWRSYIFTAAVSFKFHTDVIVYDL